MVKTLTKLQQLKLNELILKEMIKDQKKKDKKTKQLKQIKQLKRLQKYFGFTVILN